jgi:hypothetical protein
MSDMHSTVSRRGFIGSCLLAVPGIRIAAALAPIIDSEFKVIYESCDWLPDICMTTYLNGSIKARCGNHPMERLELEDGWQLMRSYADGVMCEMRIKRPGPNELYIDWMYACAS